MDDVAGWRKRIDELDIRLLELLNARAQCAIAVGKIKTAEGLKIHNPEREKAVLENVMEGNKGPLDNDSVRRIFECIIEECRKIEIIAV